MQRTRDRPPEHDDKKATTGAEAIEKTAATDVKRCIREQKGRLKIGKLLIRDWDIVLNCGDGDGQSLPVEVADGDRGCHERD